MVGKVGDPASIVGRRVDNQKLLDMNAYLDALPAPPGAKVNIEMSARGREHFRANCTQCHNVDQSKFVPPMLVEMKTIWPGYLAIPVGKRGDSKLSLIQNAPGIFDDKMIVVDASDRGEKRGNALPLLLDLARTKIFLHDGSVSSLDNLLDPARGENAPHPFYLADAAQRADMVEFLKGLDTGDNIGAAGQTRQAATKPLEQRSGFSFLLFFPVTAAAGLVCLKLRRRLTD
jgi:mono/diheme cytochrome c family protein